MGINQNGNKSKIELFLPNFSNYMRNFPKLCSKGVSKHMNDYKKEILLLFPLRSITD